MKNSPRAARKNWLESADLVVLPAFAEHKPRRLLEAAARGVPVVASKNCGVGNVDGITKYWSGRRSNSAR